MTSHSLRLANLVSSMAVVALSCGAYWAIPYWRGLLLNEYGWVGFSFSGAQYMVAFALAYAVGLAFYYGLERYPQESKSLRMWRFLMRLARSPREVLRTGWTTDERLAVLATLLKAYFAPMMAIILMRAFMGGFYEGWRILHQDGTATFIQLFNQHGFWFVMNVLIFIDVACFTVGYLVETPRLKNEIRSVDPTLLGWAAALLCYYPFSVMTGAVLGRQVSDFPQFDDPTAHLSLNILLLVLMAIYMSASLALGAKGSNLTHRGIVCRGPYAVVRHPAYACKNMAWWIGAIPVVSQAWSASWFMGLTALASVVGWSMLYVLRALTEEDHLRKVDGEYDAYMQKVRWRFLPGVV